ncbi:uncharacterized protein LAESUDRAFT_763441 [Laetiporus sulphureus 93-53]|uniref:Uncharacterized protein n=1 Tax=Laetiporus sulphureus 93-53 TaxID=1314785 RepID=A0A165BV54_9APHY|nr:uncharacterized protein LAESUDRAFT_763441 [Laetiporus sulphureus 93-53]KZT01712.1 hypothetical protein LAESUDRAFT_763441 [Laetiporus sulphureus 93-53]
MKSMVDNELKKMYNVLSDKMYEHKRILEASIQSAQTERRLKEAVLKFKNEKLLDRIKAQDTHMVILNDEITSTQRAMLDMGKKMMELGSENTKLHHELASLKASSVTTMQGHTSGQVQLRKLHVKIAEPPHYSGKGSLEDWLQQLSIRMQWNEINDNEICYKDSSTAGTRYLRDFIDILKVNYRTLDPDKDAQQHLKEICTKTYPTMVSFAERFCQWATKTNLGHITLISYIAEHRDKDPEYLDLCLQLEFKFRADKAGHRGTTTSSSPAPRASKDPNAMAVNHVS